MKIYQKRPAPRASALLVSRSLQTFQPIEELQPGKPVEGQTFIDAWIDVPDMMHIVLSDFNVFEFRYRVGDPNAEGLFAMLFFDTPEDRNRLENPLQVVDGFRLPRAIFKPAMPVISTEPNTWHEGTFQLYAPESRTEKYRDAYIGAGIIYQPEYAGSRSPLEIPEGLDTL